MTQPLLVGIDVGTSGVKALAISPDGEVVARAEEEYSLSIPRPGWAEQDPDDWWRATERALAALPPAAAIGLSGQMHGLVALDERDRVLRPAILWNDQRTAAECAELEKRIGLDRLIALTGNRALPGFTAPKLLWLRKHEPDVYARIAHVLLPKDYIRLRLTGERATDVADASGTLLFDVARRRWSDDVLDALELPRAWLPEVFESPDVPGAPGAGDQAAGALGVGIDRPGPVSVVLGTSGVVFAVLPSFAADAEARVHAFCHAVPGAWHAMGVMLSAAGALRLASRVRVCAAPTRSSSGRPSDGSRASRASSSSPTSRASARRTPTRLAHGGVRRPVAPPRRRRHDAGGARGRRLRAARLLRAASRARRRGETPAASPAAARAASCGCGSSPPCSASRSSARSSRRAPRYGAALLAGVRAGVFADVHEAIERAVRVRDVVEPDPAWLGAYDEGYARYRRLYPALRPLED